MERQMNKRFGIQKLKKIVQTPSNKWFVSSSISVKSLRRLPQEKLGKAPRVMVRTDEAGRVYNHLDWYKMPRFEVRPNKDSKSTSNEMRKEEAKQFNSKAPPETYLEHRSHYPKRRRYLLVPTRPREDIAVTGLAELRGKNGKMFLNIYLFRKPEVTDATHRNLLNSPIQKFEISGGQFKQIRGKNSESNFGKYFSSLSPKERAHTKALLKNIAAFVRKGIETRQLKPGRLNTQISFLTWKDAPTRLELFDLIETRQVQDPE